MSQNNDLTRFDKESSNYLRDVLFGDKIEKRAKWETLFKNDTIFHADYPKGFDETRELAFRRIKAVADAKLFSIFDFEHDPTNLFTSHEMLG